MRLRSLNAHSLPTWCAVAGAVVWLVVALRLIALPEPVLVTNLLVDDAFYFALPAKNLLAGHGFSFDGLQPSNGVQAAWALVTVALAAVFDDTALLRAMLVVGAGCWLAAAFGIWRWLLPRSPAAAALAASGLLWCGVHDRLAFKGMENALQALLTVGVLLAGSRAVRGGWRRTHAWWLGVAMAMLALGRTEAAMIGVFVGVPVLLGWLGAGVHSRGERLQLVLRMALPGVLLIGGLCGFYRVVFDSWLPVSGSVKTFYEDRWGRAAVHGGLFENVVWHLRFVRDLAIAPLREVLPRGLVDATGMRLRLARNAVWLVVGMIALVALLRRWRARPAAVTHGEVRIADGMVFLWPMLGFAVVHTALMGSMLPHFTIYGSWYFASECVIAWLLLGVIAASAAPVSRVVRGILWALVLLLAAAGAHGSRDLTHDVRTNHFREAGLWLRQHSEPGARIGAMSAGLVGWYASDRHVLNLDGLINTRAFLDEVLRRDRMHDYFAAQQITWISDYQPRDGWQNGLGWCGNIPAQRLVPRHYARLVPDDAYVIWQVLPEGSHFELLGAHGPALRDCYAELAVAADVHGRFAVIAGADLAAHLVQHPQHVVARSLVEEPYLRLLHVLATREQLAAIALDQTTVQPQVAADVQVLPGLRVLGYDVVAASSNGARRLAVTVFWDVTEPQTASKLWLCALDAAGALLDRVPLGTCHGTMPLTSWSLGRVVPESAVLSIGTADAWHLAIERESLAEQRHLLPAPPR